MGNLHQIWQGSLGVYSFEVLSLGSVLIFAKHLQIFFPVDSFCVVFLYLLNTYMKKIQDLCSLVWCAWCWMLKQPLQNLPQPKSFSKSAEAAKPHRGLSLCFSHLSTPLTDPDIIPLCVRRLIVKTELCTLEWCLLPQGSVFVGVNFQWTIYGSLPAALKRTAGVRVYEEGLIFN